METDAQVRWGRVKDVFQRALECDAPQRDALVRSLCGDDSDLEALVQRLLRHEQAANAHCFLVPLVNMVTPRSGDLAAGGAEDDTLPSDPTHWQIPGYRLLRSLGEGGMGQVWSAVQEGTGQEVAVKFVRPELLYSDRARERFDREIKLTASLNHRHIARVYADGVAAGRRYYVLELIHGQRLDQYVQAAPRGEIQLLELFRMICEAMEFAHARGVIHRDLKPSNILVTPEGEPKILDFGLARASIEGQSPLTLSGPLGQIGTPGYMSPEQRCGAEVDARTDVFALGVILADMMGLRNRAAAVAQNPPGARTRNERIASVIRRATAPSAEDRYPSAGALAKDIAASIASAGHRRRQGYAALLACIAVGALALLFFARRDDGAPRAALPPSAAANVLRILGQEKPPASTIDSTELTLRFTIDARRRGNDRFTLLRDGDALASPDDDAATRDDEYVLLLEPQSPGYLYVFQIDARGQVQWLFPRNEAIASSGSNPVARGGVVQLPEPKEGKLRTFVLDDHAGVEHVYAVLSAERWPALEAELSSPDGPAASSPTSTSVAVTDPFDLLRGDRRGVGGIVVYDDGSHTTSNPHGELPRIAQQRQTRAPFLLMERWFRHVP